VADRVRQRAKPGAWIVDFTNPVGIVTRSLLDAGHKAVGLCNVAIGFQRRFAGYLGVDPSSVVLDHVGLNHLTWERGVYVDGVDHLPALLAEHLPELAAEVDVDPLVLSTLGNVPSYYLSYFYAHDRHVREAVGAQHEVRRGPDHRQQRPADTERVERRSRDEVEHEPATVAMRKTIRETINWWNIVTACYMLEPWERAIFNSVAATFTTALAYGVYTTLVKPYL